MGFINHDTVSFPIRISHSLIPPFMGQQYNRIYVDVLGPSFAILLLILLLEHGHNSKDADAALKTTPTVAVITYCIAMPLITFVFTYCAKSSISLVEILSLLGYSLYGHVFTILTSILLASEESNTVFFLCMIVFGGCATLRLALLMLKLISVPIARLLVCSFVSMTQLLFLLFLHFTYMHPTFVYGHAYVQVKKT